MPAIIFSRIYLFGAVFDIFAVSEMPKNPESFCDLRDGTAKTLFLLPSLDADALVVSYKNPATSPTAAVAAAAFLTLVRGLPMDEVRVESHGKFFDVSFCKVNGTFSISLDKCKQLLSKSAVLVDKMKFSVSEYECLSDRILTVKCSDATCFDESALSRIMLEYGHSLPCGAVAYSLLENRVIARAKFINFDSDNIVRAALSVARDSGVGTLFDRLDMEISDTTLSVSCLGNRFVVTFPSPKHFTLAAPDIL